MLNWKTATRAVLLAALGALAFGAPAHADGVKVGMLICNIDSGWGYVVGSSRRARCNFVSNTSDQERYAGSVSKAGLDVGYTQGGVIVWTVIAASIHLPSGALEGAYGSRRINGNDFFMVGGPSRSIALQPVNVTTGITLMNLKFEKI
jgi:hypothetical protein